MVSREVGDDQALRAALRDGQLKRGTKMRNTMIKTVQTKFCTECGGLRHGSQCMCRTDVQFTLGCCTTCNGSGEIRVRQESREAKNVVVKRHQAVFQAAS